MLINGKQYKSIWLKEEKKVQVFDQRLLPHKIEFFDITSSELAAYAIKEMVVRGAPLIGGTAAYGVYLAVLETSGKNNPEEHLRRAAEQLKSSRPTAVNLFWAVDRMLRKIAEASDWNKKIETARSEAEAICEEDIRICESIGEHGLKIIEEIYQQTQRTVNILTHCNAGWLATIDWGTATAPIYKAHKKGIPVHVWVDETRPRNQGAKLTAFELLQEGVPHTLIADNTGGHLMQHGFVDLVIVGTDRTTPTGFVANKIGTYLKALAAKDNNVPFYAAVPSSSIDWNIKDALKEIPIETRSEDEVKYIRGKDKDGKIQDVLICPEETPAINYGFDVTPPYLVTGLITERGIAKPNEESIYSLFPEYKKQKNHA